MTSELERNGRIVSFEETLKGFVESLAGYGQVWGPSLLKVAGSLRNLEEQLLLDNDTGQLSVTAQMILEQATERVVNLTEEYMRQHKNIHNNVSKLGKAVDRTFTREICGFLSREKDLEGHAFNRSNTCTVIHDFLLSEGMIDEAEMLRKEASLTTRKELPNAEKMKIILDDMSNRNVLSALQYISGNFPHEAKLNYDLRQQYVLQLVYEGREVKALGLYHCSNHLGRTEDTLAVIGAALHGPAFVKHPKFKHLYNDYVWKRLICRVAEVLSPVKSNLLDLMETGTQVVAMLSGLKRTFSKGNLAIDEELPVEIKIKRQIHSTFTCPILKEQSTDRNPPMKLLCGHVISREAMNRLSANRLVNPRAQMPRYVKFRQTRLKCPYCPKEQNFEAAKRVLFSHVQF